MVTQKRQVAASDETDFVPVQIRIPEGGGRPFLANAAGKSVFGGGRQVIAVRGGKPFRTSWQEHQDWLAERRKAQANEARATAAALTKDLDQEEGGVATATKPKATKATKKKRRGSSRYSRPIPVKPKKD